MVSAEASYLLDQYAVTGTLLAIQDLKERLSGGDPEPLKNQVCEGTFYLQRKMRNGFGETFVSAQFMLASTDLV